MCENTTKQRATGLSTRALTARPWERPPVGFMCPGSAPVPRVALGWVPPFTAELTGNAPARALPGVGCTQALWECFGKTPHVLSSGLSESKPPVSQPLLGSQEETH